MVPTMAEPELSRQFLVSLKRRKEAENLLEGTWFLFSNEDCESLSESHLHSSRQKREHRGTCAQVFLGKSMQSTQHCCSHSID